MKLSFDKDRNLHQPFQTPLASFLLPGHETLNSVLSEAVLQRRERQESVQRSNAGGWHSDDDLLDWPEVLATDFRECLQDAVRLMTRHESACQAFDADIEMEAWANVNGPGDFNAVHNHPNNHWSGVYYVQAGDYSQDSLPHAGHIELIDPRGGINAFAYPGNNQFGASVRFAPHAGMLLMFPSWLKHTVIPFRSDTLRISIAFNAVISRFEPAG